MSKAIGIKLGTTYTGLAYYHNNKLEVIANDIPSVAALIDGTLWTGKFAEVKANANFSIPMSGANRLIGRKFDDPDVQKNAKYFPFKLVNQSGKPAYQVEFKGETKVVSPVVVSAMILKEMKETAESFIGETVTDAVITVPTHFNNAQRKATLVAAKIAGLKVLRLINESTAAAIGYCLNNEDGANREQNVLIFNSGGGTVDASLMSIEGRVLKVTATVSDAHLGGEDFDNRLVDHFVQEFKRKNGKDITGDQKAMRRLRIASEQAKKKLSSSSETTIVFDSLYEGIDFYASITRARFEELCGDLFRATIMSVEQVLKDANMHKSDVDEIVVVGGSTRIPKVQELLSHFFNDKTLNKSIMSGEAVACGAAAQAAMLIGDNSLQDLVVEDVIPLSIGMRIQGVLASNMIPRFTPIPRKFTNRFDAAYDDQECIRIQIYEGEDDTPTGSTLLGEIALPNIQPTPADHLKFDVTFQLDANGILTASAVESGTNGSVETTIVHDKSIYSLEEIEQMDVEVRSFKKKDGVTVRSFEKSDGAEVKSSKKSDGAKAGLFEESDEEDKVFYKSILEESIDLFRVTAYVMDELSAGDKQAIIESTDNAESWMQSSPNATWREYDDRLREMYELYNRIFRRVDPARVHEYPARRDY